MTSFGEGEWESDSHGWWIEVVLLVELLVFDNFDSEIGFGDFRMGQGGLDAIRDVSVLLGVE